MTSAYATTEAAADAEARAAARAAAMLAGERWARRPDTTWVLALMSEAATATDGLRRRQADRLLSQYADEAESRAVLAAVLAPRVGE